MIAVRSKMCRASLETRNFVFEAYGFDDEGARETLIAALKKHAIRSKMTPDWWEAFADGIQYRDVELGKAYRDGELLK